jgi:hypothetical protein
MDCGKVGLDWTLVALALARETQASFAQTHIAPASQYQMVEHLNVQEFASFDDLAGDQDILLVEGKHIDHQQRGDVGG